MKKKVIFGIIAGLSTIYLSGCNNGSTGAINVSAQVTGGSNGTVVNGNSCTNMVTGSTCDIQLTLNNNSQPNLNLTYSQLPIPFMLNPSFASGIDSCQLQINNSNNVQVLCNITLTYQNPTPGETNSTNANLTFYLGNPPTNNNSNSNTITLSGN